MKTAIEVILNTAGLTQEEQYKIFLGDLEELALESKPLSFYLKKMVTSRPELEILKQGLKAKHAQVAVVKSDYFPQIFIGGMLRFAYAPNREEPNNAYISDYFNTFSLGAGVGLKQKLGFHTTYAKLEESRAQLMELQRQNSLLNHVLPLEVKKNYYALQETQQRLEASYSSYKAGKSWFRSVGMNYGVGICDIDEMLEAYGAYIKTKTMYYKAILDFNLAVIELNASAGIFDFSPTTVGD